MKQQSWIIALLLSLQSMWRYTKPQLILLVLLAFGTSGLAQNSYWQKVEISQEINTRKNKTIRMPDSYQTFVLNQVFLQDLIWNAPTEENQNDNGVIIEIPRPNGSFDRFIIYETNVFNTELAREYSKTIKTFVGRKWSDPSIEIRLSLSPIGFYGIVFEPNTTYLVEPISGLEQLSYMSYYKSDFPNTPFACGYEDILDREDIDQGSSRVPANLRQYRLVYVPTGEFSVQFGVVPPGSGGTPTVANVQASIATSVNIANAVFTRDAGIKLQNNTPNSVIFLNPATDPYDPSNSGGMLTANQMVVDNAAGTANYDIGHVVAFGNFGGVAVADVCGAGQKAQGYSSGDTPLQQITIDYFCHEAGHQFGASHTFSATSCGTAVANSRYEPGEGNSIMAYANVCNAMDRIQSFSDPFFHCRSINQMNAFVSNTATCNTTPVTTGNPEDPTVNCCSTLNIPKNTPFVLVGTVSDATDQATLVSDWEQFDLAPATTAGPPSATQTMGPNFRLRPASSTGNKRIFPATAPMGDNDEPWERLSSVARTMNFQLVARDNNSNWGRTAKCASVVTVTDEGPFAVISPNGNETVASGNMTNVTWGGVSANTCAKVDIFLSLDGGASYPIVLATNVDNDGSEMVNINTPGTTQAKVLIQCHTTDGAYLSSCTFFDASNTNFTITSNCLASSSAICPVNAMTLPVGDAGLNLSISNSFGSAATTHTFNITTSSLTGPLANATTSGGTTCQTPFGAEKYEMFDFVPSASGAYTFTKDAPFVVFSIFAAAGYNPAMPCSGTFLGSNSTGAVSVGASATVSLTACTKYKVILWSINGATVSSTISFSGPGSIYEAGSGPGADYDYTYVAVNTSNNQIAAVSSSSDFSNLTSGTYCIYGASYKASGISPPVIVNPATWIGMTIGQIASSGQCVIFSSNCKPLTVTSNCAISNVSATTPACMGTSTTFIVSATVTGGSGNYNVVNAANNAVLGTINGATTIGNIMVNITIPNATGQVLMVKVVDMGMAGCMSPPISVSLPNCAPVCDIMIANITTIAETCSNLNNGQITVTATGTGTIEYSINGTTFQPNNLFMNMAPGNYTVTVRIQGANPVCSTSQMATVAAAVPLMLTTTKVDVTGCPNGNNGSINLTVTGGAPNYIYSWTTTNGSGLAPSMEDQGNLTAGNYTVIVTDANSCSASTSVTINDGMDTTNPSISCPASINLTCNISEIPAYSSLTAFQTAGGNASDNCMLDASTFQLLSETNTVNTCSGGTYTRTYQIADATGNTASCTQTLVLPAPSAPMVSCAPDAIIECAADINPSEADVIITSACNLGTTVMISPPMIIGQSGCDGTVYSYTYTVRDDCGGTASCTRNYTLVNSGPSISCGGITTVTCEEDIVVNVADAMVSTSCGLNYNVTIDAPIVYGQPGCNTAFYAYVYTVTDECGRSDFCHRYFQIINDGPMISCPASATVECKAEIFVHPNNAIVTTSCDYGSTVTVSGPIINGAADCPETTYTYTYRVLDECGRSATCEQVFTIENNEDPQIEAPADQAIECGFQVNLNPDFAEVWTSCGQDFQVSISEPIINGTPDCPGTTYAYVYTVTDACGRSTSDTRVITINNDGPIIECPDNYLFLNCEDYDNGDLQAKIGAWMSTVSATSSCGIPTGVTNNFNPNNLGMCMNNPFTDVTFFATDNCGRTASCTGTIIMVDTEAPSIKQEAQDMIADCWENLDIVFQNWLNNHGGAIAIDECSPNLNWSTIPANPTISCNGQNNSVNVTFVATDQCGNAISTTATFSVTTFGNPGNNIGGDEPQKERTIELTEEEINGNRGFTENKLVLFQNRPNPFRNETIISFYLPKEGIAILRIYDLTGKVIHTMEENYSRGYQEVMIRRSDLRSSGIFYYQIQTKTHSDTQKMIMD